MITIKNITKSFGSLQVLKGIDLHIDKGEIVSIVGPSGAGKTTLLQIIGTLDRPDSGEVIVNGIDTSRLSKRRLSDFRNRHIGFVFQFHQLLPEFTAIENIMIPAFIAGMSRRQAKRRAEELLDFMNLKDRASHKPNELSGGEKQRVAVARALVNNPAVILADEPSGNLDSVTNLPGTIVNVSALEGDTTFGRGYFVHIVGVLEVDAPPGNTRGGLAESDSAVAEGDDAVERGTFPTLQAVTFEAFGRSREVDAAEGHRGTLQGFKTSWAS